jgi:tetratricopeptide (TPR) repeat protein
MTMPHSSTQQPFQYQIVIKIEQPVEGVAQYQAEIATPKGTVFNDFILPGDWTTASLSQILNDFRTGVATNRYVTMRDAESDVLTPSQFGTQLFQTIFSGESELLYRDSLRSAQSRGESLPVRLDIQPASLARLPWEFLFDPQETSEIGYLCFGAETPIIRFFDKEPRPPTYDPPLRLLLVSANPEGLPNLNLERECDIITEAIEPLTSPNKAQLTSLFEATIDNLSERIRNFRPHIVHFMGHGNVDRLMFEDDTGSSTSVAINLRNDPSLRLVVLNACKAGGVSKGLVGAEARMGVARSLAKAGIPAIVAMQFSISNGAAIVFAERFYKVLAEERPVDEALTWARIAMQDKLPCGSLEWATPVLYIQTTDGHLFDDLLKPDEATIGVGAETKETEGDGPLPEEEQRASDRGEATTVQPEPTPPTEELRVKLEIYYQDGVRYFDQGEWEKAIGFLQTVYDLAVDYRDTDRLLKIAQEKLEKQKQVRRQRGRVEILFKQAEQHFKARHWREALDLLHVIQNDDPAFRADEVDQMVTDAGTQYQAELEDRAARLRLQTLYQRAKDAMDEANWTQAIYVLEELERQSPGYQDVQYLLREGQRQRLLSEEYTQGQAAFDENDWDAAVAHFGRVHAIAVDVDEKYKDVSQKLEAARREQNLDARYQEGLDFLAARRWREALKALEPIPDNDLRRREAPLARNYAQAWLHMEAEEWEAAVKLLQPLASTDYQDAGELLQTTQQQKRWAVFFERGQEAMEAKQWNEAIKNFEVVVNEKYDYKGGEARNLLAEAEKEAELKHLYDTARRRLNSQHWAEAISLLEQIPQDHPNYEDVRSLLHQAQQEKNRFELYNRAVSHADHGEWPQAIAAFEQLLIEAPDGYRDAKKRLEAARRQSNLLKEYWAAEAAIKRLDWSQAVVLLERVVSERANFLDAVDLLDIARRQFRLEQLYDEGKRHMQAHRWAEAIMALEDLQSRLDPDKALDRAYANTPDLLAQAHEEKKLADIYQFAREAMAGEQWNETIEALQKIERIRHDYKETTSMLAQAQIELDFSHDFSAGREAYNAESWEIAISHFRQALNHKPNHDEAAEMLGEAQRQRDIQKALQEGQQYEAEENWGEAAGAYRCVIELDPYHPEAINKLSKAERRYRLTDLMVQGNQALEAENWDQAIQVLEDVVQIDPSYDDVGEKLVYAKQQRQLAEKYQQAQANLVEGQQKYDRRKLEITIDLLAQIEQEEPQYERVAHLLETARTQLQLLDDYTLAERLFNAERWSEAAEKFQEISVRQKGYRDTQAYLERAKDNQVAEQHWDRAEHLLQGSEPSEKDLQKAKTELERITTTGRSAYLERAEARIREIESRLEQLIAERQQRIQQIRQEMLASIERQNWDQAEEALGKLCRIHPDGGNEDRQKLMDVLQQAAEKADEAEEWEQAEELWGRLRRIGS